MEPLLRPIVPDCGKPHFRWARVQLGSCCARHLKASGAIFAENDIIRVPQPAHGPDLALLDFWLFGDTKGALTEQRLTGAAHRQDEGALIRRSS
jgi:hypothetical protein